MAMSENIIPLEDSRPSKDTSFPLSLFVEYATPRFLVVRSKTVAVIYRTMQLVLLYIIFIKVLLDKEQSQDYEKVLSAVTTKVKGIQYTNFTKSSIGSRIWDAAEYVVPPQESNTFFITTKVVITPDQSFGSCPEDPNVPDAICTSNADCQPKYRPLHKGNGVTTGNCIQSQRNKTVLVCEIYAWCPVEMNNATPENEVVFEEVQNFTVLIKNVVRFPKFKILRGNTNSTGTKDMKDCIYDPIREPHCPIMGIGRILDMTKVNFSQIARTGGVIAIKISWDCNMVLNITELFTELFTERFTKHFTKSWDCQFDYTFYRLDNENDTFGNGHNFRYSHNYRVNGREYRTLIKAYGIMFKVFVTGKAGMFNPSKFYKNVGSSLALLGVASWICDCLCYILFIQCQSRCSTPCEIRCKKSTRTRNLDCCRELVGFCRLVVWFNFLTCYYIVWCLLKFFNFIIYAVTCCWIVDLCCPRKRTCTCQCCSQECTTECCIRWNPAVNSYKKAKYTIISIENDSLVIGENNRDAEEDETSV